MTFVGEVQNGQIVFPNPIPLADGTRVRVEKLDEPQLIPFGVRDPNRTTEEILEEFRKLSEGNSLGGLSIQELRDEGRR
jgi:hypothetical protein